MPIVPRLAALRPSNDQICRRKWATDVLPFVPGHGGDAFGLSAVEFRGHLRETQTGILSAINRAPSLWTCSASSGAPSTTTAPRFTASSMKRPPSVFVPLSAANRNPGLTSRLSAASPLNSVVVFFTAAAVPTCPTLASDYGSIMEISRSCRGERVVPPHAQERRNTGYDAPDCGSSRPAACGKAKAGFVAFGLIYHDEDEILRL